jgi:UDP-N-acetylmuramate dehydrogenase
VRWRREHQPGGQNAGSVFVNPVPGQLSAGEVIDELGLRGLRIGTAEVSRKHANFIQADEGGRADDVRAVMAEVRARVLDARGIALRSEIRQVGFDDRDDGVRDRELAP